MHYRLVGLIYWVPTSTEKIPGELNKVAHKMKIPGVLVSGGVCTCVGESFP